MGQTRRFDRVPVASTPAIGHAQGKQAWIKGAKFGRPRRNECELLTLDWIVGLGGFVNGNVRSVRDG